MNEQGGIRWYSLILFIIAVLLGILLLVPILFVMGVTTLIASIPSVLGRRTSGERMAENVVDRFIGKDLLIAIRDDLIEVYIPVLDLPKNEGLDKWGMMREADRAQEIAQDRLVGGESVLTFVGGIVSVLASPVTGLGPAIALFLIFLSITVALRVVAINILAFDSLYYRYLSTKEMIIMRGWNCGPINGKEVWLFLLLSLLLSVFAKPGTSRYNFSMSILADLTAARAGRTLDKWQTESSGT